MALTKISALSFRGAVMADAELLYAWRNDSLTREMSHDSSLLDWSQHLDWLSQSLTNIARNMFLCFLGETAIGTVRVDQEQECAELSWTISPDSRGQGYGSQMLAEFLSQYPGKYRAEVKKNNVASQHMCEKVGFFKHTEEANRLHYRNYR